MMTITLLLAGAALAAAMGLYDAYANKRGVFGWIVSIAASVVGGVTVGMMLPMLAMTAWNPPKSTDPTLIMVVGLASVLVGVIAGSSIALWIVNRFR
ncbi:MAG: hypothetical protein K2Z80_28035 [Xanthobacteraceae bacterium]|nr:hypothetical protein [Xanthobacteraceae bacterium]